MCLIHFERISNRAVRLGLEVPGAAVPEKKRGVSCIYEGRSVAPSSCASNAYGQFPCILESEFRTMAGSARYRVIFGEPGVVKQLPAQSNRVCSGMIFACERNWRQPQRNRNGNGGPL